MEKSRILIIDDDPNLRKTLSDILRVKGYETYTAEDGEKGLAFLRDNQVNLALIDLGLPGISGLEVLTRAKADFPATEAIILTGNATIDSAVEATKRGAFSYLVKPYDIEQLMNHIQRAIEKQQAELEIARHRVELERMNAQLKLLSQAIEQTPTTVIVTDREGNIVYVNPHYAKVTGYAAEEAIGRNPRIVKSDWHPPEFFRELWETILAGREWHGEFRNRRKDGRMYWESASISPVKDAAGEITHFVSVQEDVTERKEAAEKLGHAYQQISADLAAAADIQKSLLPKASTIEGVRFDWLFYPSSFVAGDIFNYFRIGHSRVGFYLLDVSGHGVPAAMLSVSLNWMLARMAQNEGESGETLSRRHAMSPSSVLATLNKVFSGNLSSGQFITMIYGVIDCEENRLIISQAGLPPPIYRGASGRTEVVGSGGFPIGLKPGIEYEDETIDFHPGDRLFLYSDGITECFNAESRQFSEERLVGLIGKRAGQPLDNLLETVRNELTSWRGGTEFDDDVTMLAIERGGK